MNVYEYVHFERNGKIGTDQPAQTMAVQRPRAAVSRSSSVVVKGDSVVPYKNGKATNSAPDQTKPKKVY